MGLHLRLAIAAVVVLFSGGAHALTPYYWIFSDRSGPNFDSPASACSDALAYLQRINPGATVSYSGYVMVGADKASCNFSVAWPSTTVAASQGLVRVGDGCEEGESYDAAKGQCLPPPADCSATQGEPFPAKGPDSPVISSGGRNYIADGGAPTACYQQCQYASETGRSTSCYLVKGSTTQGFCNYILNGTGENCGADSYQFSTTGDQLNPSTDPADPSVPPSDPNDPGCPDGWAWSGTTCVKTDPSNPGDGSGSGEGNGEGGNGNGGGNNGGGNGGDGEGNGDGNGEGNGNGEGSGNGSGEGDGEGEGECDPAKNPNCAEVPGPSGSLEEPAAGSWDKANAEWDDKVAEAKRDLKDAVKANIDQLKGAFDLQLSTGGGQLPCEAFTVWGKSYRLCVADYSTQLSYMRLALLLMAALIAAFVILKD